jgi:anthranilate 1,2-dioxygenase large subunit
LGTTSQILHNNWKLYFENVRDTYHATLLHSFFTTFRMSRLTSEGGVDITDNGMHHASYTRNKIDRVGAAASDALYAGIPSMRENFRLAEPGFLAMKEEFGDDTTTQILSVFPNFVLQQIQNSIALRLVLPKGPDKTELQWIYLGFEEDDAQMTALRRGVHRASRPLAKCYQCTARETLNKPGKRLDRSDWPGWCGWLGEGRSFFEQDWMNVR